MGPTVRASITVLVTLAVVVAPVGTAAVATGIGVENVESAGVAGDGPELTPAGSENRTGNGSVSLSVADGVDPRTTAGTTGRVQWDRTYDRKGADVASAVLQTSDGGYLLAGTTRGSGSVDQWFVKTDASGNEVWTRTYGTDDYPDRIRDLVETDDGYVYVGSRGTYNGSRMVVGKIDDSGNSEWVVRVDDGAEPADDVANSVIQTGDQRFLVGGEVTPQGAGSQQAIVFEVDVSGSPTLLWSQLYGGDDVDDANAVATAPGDGYVFAGRRNFDQDDRQEPGKSWLVRVGPQGEKRWETTFADGAATDVLRRDGGYFLVGESGPQGLGGERSPWVKRVDSDGNAAWTQSPPYVSCAGVSLAPRDGGGVAAVGETCTDIAAPEFFDGWIATYDSSGNREFNTSFGSSGYSAASAVAATDDGGYAVAGSTDADTDTAAFWLTKFAGSDDGGDTSNGTVDRIEFDYSEFGGSVNLEVNGTRKVVDNLEDLDGYQIETAVVHVPDPAGGQGSGHVRITGEIGSFSVGGQEFSLDNVTFAADGREKTVRFDDLIPEQDSYPVGGEFESVPTGIEMSVVPYVYSDGDRERDTSGSIQGGAYWAGNTNLQFDVGSVFEGRGAGPDVVDRSVRIDPYPIGTGDQPTLTVNVTGVGDDGQVVLRRWVNGTREENVRMRREGDGVWTGELPSVARPGTNVTLEVIARNADGAESLATFPGTDEHLGYYVFRDVREVGVVLGRFPGETLPGTLDDADALETWKLANEVDLNHFYGSDNGSMGAVGFDLNYHSNGTDLYTVDRTRAEYQALNGPGNRDAGAERFVSDLRSAASDDVGYGQYAFWVAAHPGTGGDRLIDSSTLAYWNPGGVFGNSNGRIYIQTEADEDVWRHEFGHAIGFDHVDNGTEAAAMMSSNNLFLRHFVVPTRVGDNGGGVSWLSKDVTDLGDVGDDGTDLVVPTLRSYDLGDSVPTVRVNRWWGHSTTDYTLGSLASVNNTYVWRGNALLGENELDDPLDSVRDKIGVVSPVCIEFTLMSEDGTGEDFESTVDAEQVPCGQNAVVATLGDRTTVQGSTSATIDGGPEPDLDLRAVDAQGRITGVTEDGEFVNRIPGATASGDRDGLEWIVVPENASVRFVVTTADLQRFVRRTEASRDDVTTGYDISVTRYGDDAEVVTGPEGRPTVNDTATTVTSNRTIGVGETRATSPPVADAGQSRAVMPNQTVELDGTGSTDPAGDSLTYRWSQTGGPDVVMTDRETPTPTFTAPDVDGEAKLRFRLAVDDGTTTDTDTVTVTVGSAQGPVDRVDENDDGEIDDGELQTAIGLWVAGKLSDSGLQAVIRAWVVSG